MQKAIVIGAGIGGLAAAVRLLTKGYKVVVFEANVGPGGKLSEFRKGGFRFDAGPSLFTMPELVEELFILAGKRPEHHFSYAKLEDVCRYFYEDGTVLTATSDPEAFASEAQHKTGVDREKVVQHLNKSAYIYEATAGLFLEKSLHKLSSYISLQTLWSVFQLPFLNLFTSMHQANEQALGNEKMVQLFNRYATYNGSNPYRAPGILNIIPHLEFGKGAYYPSGGMYNITKSIYDLACSLGVDFQFGQKVERIVVRDRQAKGVEVGGAYHEADVVVCNMDVVLAYRHLMPKQNPPRKILKQERSSSALIFYWGMNRKFEQLQLHNIFFSQDYAAEFAHIFDRKGIFHDPTIYVNITAKQSPEDAPQGMENWFVMINVPHNSGQDWDLLIARARKDITAKLSRMLDIDIQPLIIQEEILEPRTIESRTQSYQGALYGTSSNSRLSAFFRHPNFSRRMRSLYFCGGSVHPGGGIPLALSSAKIVDSLIKPAKK